MGVMTVTMSTIKTSLDATDFPICSCGSEFEIIDYHRKRKPSERVGTAAICPNSDCEYHKDGILGYDPDDLLKRIFDTLPSPPLNH